MANKNFQVKHGLEVGTTVTADAATGNITTSGDVAVNGGDLTTTAATANVVNTNATTVNLAGAATAVNIGAVTGTTTINNANTVVTGDLAVNGGDITTNQNTFNLLNTTVATLNIGGAATTAVNIGNAAGDVVVAGDLQVTGNDIKSSSAIALTLSGADVAVAGDLTVTGNDIKSSTGTPITLSGNNVTISGDLAVNGGDITTNQTTFNLLTGTATTVNAFDAATAVNMGNTAGNVTMRNDLTINGNVLNGNDRYGDNDIERLPNGLEVPGILLSNYGKTDGGVNTGSRLVIRDYTSGATNTSSLPQSPVSAISFEASRGANNTTAGAPNINDKLMNILLQPNYGTTAGTGTGEGWSTDNLLTPPGGIRAYAISNVRQTQVAEFTANISGTTMTVTAVTSGTIGIGNQIRSASFTGLTDNVIVSAQTSVDTAGGATAQGGKGVYTISSNLGTLTGITVTAVLTNCVPGYLFDGSWPRQTPTSNTIINSMFLNPVGMNFTSTRINLDTPQSGYTFYNKIIKTIADDAGGDILTIPQHGLFTDDTLVSPTTAYGLVAGTVYWVIKVTNDTIRISNTRSGAARTDLTPGVDIFHPVTCFGQHPIVNPPGTTNWVQQPNPGITISSKRIGYAPGTNTVYAQGAKVGDTLGRYAFAALSGSATLLTDVGAAVEGYVVADWTPSPSLTTAAGVKIRTTKTGSSTLTDTLLVSLDSTQLNSDAVTFKNTSGTNQLTIDSSGNVVVTGDVRINGNDIQNSGGTSAITLTSGNTTTTIRGDTIDLKVAAGTAATSANVGYTRTYGEFAYTNAAGFAIAAQNTIYTMPLDTTLNNSGVTIANTGDININVSGWYKIIMSLQVTLTVSNQPGQIDFWLRKNGVDVANSKTQVDLLKDQKAVIAMDWLVNSDGNDYWEIVYVGTTANYADIDFPTIAATTTPYVSPLAPALLVNVIPAGM